MGDCRAWLHSCADFDRGLIKQRLADTAASDSMTGSAEEHVELSPCLTANGRRITDLSSRRIGLRTGLLLVAGTSVSSPSFEFQLHPVGPDVLSGLIVFPFDQAKSVLTQFARLTETMPDDLNVWHDRPKAPPLPFLSKESTEERSSRSPCAMRATPLRARS